MFLIRLPRRFRPLRQRRNRVRTKNAAFCVRGGFTLLEVAAAVAVFAVMGVSALSLLAQTTRISFRALEEWRGMRDAQALFVHMVYNNGFKSQDTPSGSMTHGPYGRTYTYRVETVPQQSLLHDKNGFVRRVAYTYDNEEGVVQQRVHTRWPWDVPKKASERES